MVALHSMFITPGTIRLTDTDDSPYWEELFVQVTDPSNLKSKFNIASFYTPPHVSTSHLTDFIDYFTQHDLLLIQARLLLLVEILT